jgi:hypothetical protein
MKKLKNARGRFTLPAWHPLNAKTPEEVIQHYRAAQGRSGGTGTVPSFIFCALILYFEKNEFYRAVFSYIYKRNSTKPIFFFKTQNGISGFILYYQKIKDSGKNTDIVNREPIPFADESPHIL